MSSNEYNLLSSTLYDKLSKLNYNEALKQYSMKEIIYYLYMNNQLLFGKKKKM